jgi:hypothetical protein
MNPAIDEEIFRKREIRRLEIRSQICNAVRDGHDLFVLLALEHRPDGTGPGDNPPYVQFAWRDDLRLQIETQGDQYRDEPYTDSQRRWLCHLGYRPPFDLGDDFENWTIMRVAEGCQPDSVARLLLDTLWMVHRTDFHDLETTRHHRVSFWEYETMISSHKRDIQAEILRRYGLPQARGA